MKTALPEDKWAALPDDELDQCANWEIWRESCMRDGLRIPPAWLKLTARQKVSSKRVCPVTWFGCPRPAVFDDPIFGATEEIVRGRKLISAEFVQIGIHWNATDKEIRDGFDLWLKQQRRRNPNAHYFRETGGKRVGALSVLMSIAMLRADAAGLSRKDAETSLEELIKKSACSSRFCQKYYKESLKDAERIFTKTEPPI